MAIEVAKGIQDHPNLKLGSILGGGRKDKRTVKLDQFVKAEAITAPVSWDFDKNRVAFPVHMWGNDAYGDCEIAGRSNMMLRLERVETRGTVKLTDEDAIDLYKQMTGCKSPGDTNDTGLYTTDNLNQWRHGWKPTDLSHTYSIDAYGLINKDDASMVRLCMYLFHGIIIGANLPITVQQQWDNNEPWDIVDNAGADAEPGSWGGHCLYGKRYNPNYIHLLTWGREVQVTNRWWNKYVDEAYCVVDSFDTWRSHTHAFNVQGLIDEMKGLGINVQQ